jgi:hypothetical protein
VTVHIEQLPLFPGGGRHVRHDSRSLAYAVGVLPRTAIASQFWQRRVPIFDQLKLGSCVGNAGVGWIGTDNAARQGLTSIEVVSGVVEATAGSLANANGSLAVDEQLAIGMYSASTYLDTAPGSYKPTDTGSDGLAVAQVLQKLGLAGSYSHAFSVDAVFSALQSGPGLLGIPWYDSMFDTDASGHVKVDASSGMAGGHEIVVPRLDVANGTVQRIWFDNSWGTSWGSAGSGWFTPGELRLLLADQGDFTVPVASAVVPVPTPVPVPPAPGGDTGCFRSGPFSDSDISVISRRAARAHQTPEAWITGRVRAALR